MTTTPQPPVPSVAAAHSVWRSLSTTRRLVRLLGPRAVRPCIDMPSSAVVDSPASRRPQMDSASGSLDPSKPGTGLPAQNTRCSGATS
jgi:hypothetical protein